MPKRTRAQVLIGVATAALAAQLGAVSAHAVDDSSLEIMFNEEVEEPKGTYTWEQLLELIPELEGSEFERPTPSSEAERTAAVPMFCERVAEIGTRLATRECYTLEQYVKKKCTLGLRTTRVPEWCAAFSPFISN